MIRIATDVGGTFTDLVAFDEETNRLYATKVSTSVEIIDGLARCMEKTALPLSAVNFFLHGSTVAINTVIERKGAKTALVTTQGFEDIIEIGRGNIPNSFDLLFTTPEPLVLRGLRMGINERLDYTGAVRRDLDVAEARKGLSTLLKQGVEAIAVCLLHSYANPAHELLLEQMIKEIAPNCFISVSSRILRQYREFERTSTTVLNAYVGPKVSSYLNDLKAHLERSGFHGNTLIMQSNGGTIPVEVAKQQPCRTMESGPVGGTIGAAQLTRSLNFVNAIAFDMGGTTAKVSTIQSGEISLTDGYFIGGYEKGFPLQLPVVDIYEVGSGGGSIAYVDVTGALKVGPVSAGGVPGPACYRLGNTRPTVTDADLILGRLNPNYFLGGEILLGIKEAEAAVRTHVGEPLGLDLVEAAQGIIRIADTNMAQAVEVMTVERGYDPRDFVLVAYGGAGPCHAVSVARELGIKKVVIPRLPGQFSAFGMLLADLKREYVLSHVKVLPEMDPETLEKMFASLEQEGRAEFRQEGFSENNLLVKRGAEMRYAGQEFTLVVSPVGAPVTSTALSELKQRFDQHYQFRYGHAFPDTQAELVSLRLEVYGLLPKPSLDQMSLVEPKDREASVGARDVYFVGSGFTPCNIYRRAFLNSGETICGPAIVEEPASTTVIHPGDSACPDGSGNLILDVNV